VDPLVAKLAIAQPSDCVVLVKALVRLGGGLHVPLDQRGVDGLGYLVGENRLAGARLTLDQQRPAEGHRSVDRNLEVLGRDVIAGALETLDHTRFSFVALRKR